MKFELLCGIWSKNDLKMDEFSQKRSFDERLMNKSENGHATGLKERNFSEIQHKLWK